MLDLPVASEDWAGAVAFYSVIHFDEEDRSKAWRELARVIRPEGWLLVAFHIDGPGHDIGSVNHLSEWFGHVVDLDGFFLDPAAVCGEIQREGFDVSVRLERLPNPTVEYPSRRCYVLAQRHR